MPSKKPDLASLVDSLPFDEDEEVIRGVQEGNERMTVVTTKGRKVLVTADGSVAILTGPPFAAAPAEAEEPVEPTPEPVDAPVSLDGLNVEMTATGVKDEPVTDEPVAE